MTAVSVSLVEFLLARIAEDEAVARAASEPIRRSSIRGGGVIEPDAVYVAWRKDAGFSTPPEADEHVAGTAYFSRFNPARVLAECEAKRRIVDLHAPIDPCDAHDARFESIPCDTLLALAQPYADHPEFREEWRA